ncbi:hypothetical protein [Alkalihalobacillus hemicellulosilyticus]|uniref:Uncharacterized protein n=1 Tax=Halalkalibacter hemicellulosilyticusJCM 9152 TaxID=1236971 RepID=W4QMK3_9BACI|nr:hypothetical protein [Halalkalibacter hemicellulosilyticus]GAE32873.1 hypothetical protein JCM9152_4464 [Halalkalibacter hemicellulosilyticusJCM 9152]
MIFNRKKDDFLDETPDLLIVFDDEQKTSDVQRVRSVDEESVKTLMYTVPKADCEITNGVEGRNFFYRAPTRSIVETGRLAHLEKNLVLTHITTYKPPEDHSAPDLTKIMMMIAIIVGFLMFGVSSCSG